MIFPPFNRSAECRYGTLLFNQNDRFIGKSLELYGEYSEGEIDLFRQVVQPGTIVLEIGANIGTHTLFFARQVGHDGLVIAFEPQRLVFQCLCANMALNQRDERAMPSAGRRRRARRDRRSRPRSVARRRITAPSRSRPAIRGSRRLS